MGLNIKNEEVEALATELALQTGLSKTEVIRRALLAQRHHTATASSPQRKEKMMAALERLWSKCDPKNLGRPISKAEREAILGFGPEGV